MKEATPDTKPLDLVALRELANETKDLAFGAVVSRLLDRIEELERENARLIETYLKTPEGVVVTKASERSGDITCSGQHELCSEAECFCNMGWCSHVGPQPRPEDKPAIMEAFAETTRRMAEKSS